MGEIDIIEKAMRHVKAVSNELQKSRYFLGFCLILAGIAVTRWFYLIDRYSVNLLFWDQWDFYEAFFFDKHLSLWQLFSWQHSPHRQGLGFILTDIINRLSGWNTRAECFAAGIIMLIALLFFGAVKRKLTGGFSRFDVILVIIVLTPLQHGIFSGTPNLSHGSVPILLVSIYCLSWMAANRNFRYGSVLLVNYIMIYTGFGIFIGIITPGLFLLESISSYRKKRGPWGPAENGAFILSVLSLFSFCYGYTFNPAVEGFQFPYPEWWNYPIFIIIGLANFWGMKGVGVYSLLAGGLTLGIFIWLIFHYGKRLVTFALATVEPDKTSKDAALINFSLLLFTLLFCANTAVGRISLGLNAAQTTRYVPYMIPAFVACYYHLRLKYSEKTLLSITLLFAIIFSTTFIKPDLRQMKLSATQKRLWKEKYLEVEDNYAAEQYSGIQIYPVPDDTNLVNKLNYLKEKKLNLYLDGK